MLAAPPARAGSTPTPPKFRLPSEVAGPVRYAVDLTIVPDQDTFTGAIDIDVNFKQSTPILWLNAEKVAVKAATLSIDGQEVAVEVIPTPKDYVGFAFAHPVGPGAARLHVSYQGEISRKDMQGIFQVKDGGEWYVYSQFENIGARRAYPCFDEPAYKIGRAHV